MSAPISWVTSPRFLFQERASALSTPAARSGIATRENIVAAVERLTRELGRFPTPPEVEAALRMKHSTLHRHVTILETAGKLRRVYGGRGLEVVKTEARP